MFKDLRGGFQLSILDKSNKIPKYYLGTVVGVSDPRIEQRPQSPGQSFPIQGFQQYQERVVDLTVEYNGKTQTYVVPENATIAFGEQFTLSCNTDAIANEVRTLLKRSDDIINSVPHHQEVKQECENILKEVSPQFADTKANDERLTKLEKGMESIGGDLAEIKRLLVSSSKKNKE